ncbi:hypothetical protein JTE90_026401 [Oedothorax gibbosus]|uniref:Uncharacterized protein n=1 Tax=Oedothorax gibbosus TaxID=931172 RepID=A0AAV6VDC8_9ARAC|nr:hypothetical protein JTE90_026401 [Oedothorax gibbosus]
MAYHGPYHQLLLNTDASYPALFEIVLDKNTLQPLAFFSRELLLRILTALNMKFLAVFLLAGLAIASAVPLFHDDLENELDQIVDELGDEFVSYSEGGLEARLRQRIEELLERIQKGVDEGKGVNKDLFNKAQDFYKKLQKLGVDVGEKIKQLIEDLRSKLGGNSPQFALDFKERLRQIRDRLKEHEFDEEKIQKFVERVLGKSEVTKQLLDILLTRGEKGKQRIIDFINRILGEDQVASSPQFALDWKERLRQIRDRLKEHEFDEQKIREFVESVLGKSEVANQLLDMLKSGGEKGKQRIIDFINRIFGENQVASSPQFALDWKERLRQIRDRLKEHEFDENKIKEFVERVLGKSEVANQLLDMLKTGGEKGKQRIIDFINRILGENQVAFSIPDKLKKRFEQMLENIQKSLEEGKVVSKDMWKKAEDTYVKLSNLGVEFSDKIKQLFEDLKSKFGQSSPQHAIISRIKERIQNLISKMHKDMEDGKGVRGDLMKKLTDALEKFRGLGGEMSQKFKDMLENLRSKFDKSSPVQQSVKEVYEKVKKFFRDLNIELKEKFTKFGEYVKDQYHKGLDNTKSKVENVRDIARKFVEDSRQISKDLAEEAQEFFHQYKEDLGHIYKDVVDKVRDILNKKD